MRKNYAVWSSMWCTNYYEMIPSKSVRNGSVIFIFYCDLNFCQHISRICRSGFYIAFSLDKIKTICVALIANVFYLCTFLSGVQHRPASGVTFYCGRKNYWSICFFNFYMTFLATSGCASIFLKMLPTFKIAARGQHKQILWAQKLLKLVVRNYSHYPPYGDMQVTFSRFY